MTVIVTDKTYTCGDFLDGASLLAQELERKDLPKRLEQAWREALFATPEVKALHALC